MNALTSAATAAPRPAETQRILVLGGDGMLGRELVRRLAARHEVAVTLRQPPGAYTGLNLLSHDVATATNNSDSYRAFHGIDVRVPEAVPRVLEAFAPTAVINAVGLIKQRPDGQSNGPAFEVNAHFPHRLAALCRAGGARLVHLSTDCVFNGKQPPGKCGYTEDDVPDAEDVYGMSKLLGEVDDGAALVLRSSILGLELRTARSLVEWFLTQRGIVRGYTRAIYTGLTTMEMARLIERLLVTHPELTGLWHAASAPITKYELLRLLAAKLGRTDVEVRPDPTVACDRSLRADRLREATGYTPPPWDAMTGELADRIRERQGDAAIHHQRTDYERTVAR